MFEIWIDAQECFETFKADLPYDLLTWNVMSLRQSVDISDVTIALKNNRKLSTKPSKKDEALPLHP